MFVTWCICIAVNFIGAGVLYMIFQQEVNKFFNELTPSEDTIMAGLTLFAGSFFLAPLFTLGAIGLGVGKWLTKDESDVRA